MQTNIKVTAHKARPPPRRHSTTCNLPCCFHFLWRCHTQTKIIGFSTVQAKSHIVAVGSLLPNHAPGDCPFSTKYHAGVGERCIFATMSHRGLLIQMWTQVQMNSLQFSLDTPFWFHCQDTGQLNTGQTYSAILQRTHRSESLYSPVVGVTLPAEFVRFVHHLGSARDGVLLAEHGVVQQLVQDRCKAE